MMKKKILYSLLSLVLCCLAGCSDDETPVGDLLPDPNKQVLTLTEVSATASSFTFNVKASDPEIPYLCLYVDKNTIDQVPKGELPAYLMDDLKKQAESKGMSFESYLASIAVKGDLENQKIEGLLPGRIYELVAFGISGTRTADVAQYLFFQTLLADPIECTFDVEVTPDIQSAQFDVVPSNKEVNYYFGILAKNNYDLVKSTYGWSDEDILIELFNQNLEYVLSQLLPQGGSLTPEIIEQALSMLMFSGDTKLQSSGLTANTEYVWMAAAFKLVETDGDQELVMVSGASAGNFKTKEQEKLELTFDIQVTDITAASANITVTPSDPNQKYNWFYDALNEETENMDDTQLMEKYIKEYGNFVSFMSVTGTQSAQAGLIPGKKHYVLAFGYDQGVTTEPTVYKFEALPGGDPAQVTFEYQDVITTPYQATLRVVPSDLSVPYLVINVPDNEFKQQQYIEMVEAQIQNDFNMNLPWNPGLTMESFLYTNSSYGAGVKETGFYSLTPATSYTVCACALTLEGKVAAIQPVQGGIVTKPLSDATVKAEFIAFYDGDEEAGEIFNNPELSQGRAIVVMKYTPSENAQDAQYCLTMDSENYDELDPNSISDLQLISGGVGPWNPIDEDGYAFTVAEWDQLYYSFAYAKDENSCEGKVNRMEVAAMKKEEAGDINELKDLVNSLNSADTRSIFRTGTGISAIEENRGEIIKVPYRPVEVQKQATVKKAQEAKPAFAPNVHKEFYLPVAHPVKK